jgi:[ribosomal protein S18]-alanine N-acetyltransferase
VKKDVLVRPARSDDLDQLLGLFIEVAEERLWIGTEPGFDQDAYRSRWERVVEEQSATLMVATEGDALIGTLSIHPDSEYGCEIGMLVKPGHRGKGVGAALLREAVRWARQQNEPSLCLLVFPHNAAAIALYERYGFEKMRRIEAFKKRQNGDVWDVILMVLPLYVRITGKTRENGRRRVDPNR